jgi:type I restriction enzyme S subunit
MDAQKFLAEFGYIASAPGGVQRLRELIFVLAAQGKLISNSGEINLTHLDKVADFVMGQAPPTAECNIRGVGDIFVKTGEFGKLYPEIKEWTTKPLKLAKLGDVLICVVGATIGKLNLGIDCAIGRSVAAIRPRESISTWYLYYSLMPFTLSLRRGSRGSAQGVIGKSELSAVQIRIPSLDEQASIVAKVDELMALCDKLEAQQQARANMELATRQAILSDLVKADGVSLPSCWERLDQSLGILFSSPESVDDFEASLKDMAVRGLLTPIIKITPDIQAIKQACTQLRDSYIAAKWMRKQKLINNADAPEDYPSHWAVVPFDEVAVVISGITKGRNLAGRKVIICPYLRVANVQRGFFNLREVKTIEITPDELGKYRLERGDLLIVEGGDWDKVGRTAIWRGDIENCLHQNHIIKARVPSDQLLKE